MCGRHATTALLYCSSVSQAGMTDKWRIEGDYFEACNCDTVCSCIFLGNPDQGQCDLTSAWHIQNGHYENTKLDSLNVAALFHTPGNMWTGPKWKAALYLDERASKEQAEALGKIYSGQAGGFFSIVAGLIGEIVGVRSVPIKFEAEGKKRSLEIPSAIDLTIEGITGGDQKSESVITNPPISVTPGFPMMVAKSVKYTYNDHGMKWDNSGKNAFYSKFTYAA
jgi:hypothetical protein